jgi:ligand-binding sensor domain-containing protein/signal transduction histidine kinase
MKNAISTLFLFLLALGALAQKTQQGEFHFNRLFVKDGLPEGQVNSLVQDKEGYMWIGTQKGLVRYDGYSPKVYTLGIEDPYKISIWNIYLDRADRLWVGGDFSVLYLYDRTYDRFIGYKSNASASDSSRRIIYNIHEDQYGHLWLLFYDLAKKKSQLELFDPVTKNFLRYDKTEKGTQYINADQFSSLSEDAEGSVWIGSENGIYQYNNKTGGFDPYLEISDTTKQNTFYLSPSQEGIFWMSVYESRPPYKGQGLWRFDTRTKAVTVFRHQENDSFSIASDNISWITTDSIGHLWITTQNGLSLYVPGKNNFINYQLNDNNTGENTYFSEMKVDNNNDIWLATSKGLVFFNTQSRTFTPCPAHEKDPYGLASNSVRNLFIDHSGTLWFGVAQLGLQWINKPLSRFVQYKDNPGQPHHFPGGVVNAFAESKDGTIWLGTAKGLYYWQPHTDSFTFVKIKKSQEKDLAVGAVMIDKKGQIWYAGTGNSSQGLYCYDPKTGKSRYFNNNKNDTTSLSNNSVSAILEDHLGNIWIGTSGGGICRFNEKSQNFTRYPFIENVNFTTPNNGALDDEQVILIYEDESGTIWVGTNNGGLNRLNRQTGRFTSYVYQLPGFGCINSILEDSKKTLWVGTYFGGVFNFDPETTIAKKYTEHEGLMYDGAIGILEDRQENLWIASSRGISIFNLQTKQVRNLTTANGLPSENLLSTYKTSSGQFLFSSNDGGFISLNPADFNPDPYPPVTHIESVDFVTSDADKAIDSTFFTYRRDNLKFHYNENRLSFHYVGLYYQNPQLNQYAYKLDGYDQDWILAGTQRMVTYTNLSPGHYTFHVKAANSDGIWNIEGDRFSFTILPPWWRTWWAYFIYLIILILIGWRIHLLQKARTIRIERDKTRDRELTQAKEIEKAYTELQSTQFQLIQSEKMASLGELTAGIAHEIQNPLNFVNNFSEVNKELLIEMKDEIQKGNIEVVNEIANDVIGNEEKILHHGKRADAIVKGMLQHSRTSSGVKEPANINALADEFLRLAYHGLRAKDKSFNATMKTDFDESIGNIDIIPQDIGRVILNLITNAFYAVTEKKKQNGVDYEPVVSVSTRKTNGEVKVSVKDNGNGIPATLLDKIFQPFFTTKPTGEGTGLGLSLSYDIIKSHGGELKVETKEGAGTEFIIILR